MKICQICEPLKDGVGRHVIDLAQGLVERGHEIHVLYSPLRMDDFLRQELEAIPGVVSRAIPMMRSPGWQDLKSIWRILGYVHRHGPFDVLHGHSSKAGVYARLCALLGTEGAVYTPHAFVTLGKMEHSRTNLEIYRLIERLMSAFTSRIICNSTLEYRHALTEIGIHPERLVTINNSLNPSTFSFDRILRRELQLPETACLIGMVGRLEDQKGVDVAIKAMAQVMARQRDAYLVVIGEGSREADLKALAGRLGVADRVIWLGLRPARRYISNFDMMLLPSRYDGFAYTLIESLWCGVPVICTPVGGVLEVVLDGINGLIVPVNDPLALAAQILRLVEDIELRSAMADKARTMITAHLSLERMCSEIEQAYFTRITGTRRVSPNRPDPA